MCERAPHAANEREEATMKRETGCVVGIVATGSSSTAIGDKVDDKSERGSNDD
jgi:hypothetical protein